MGNGSSTPYVIDDFDSNDESVPKRNVRKCIRKVGKLEKMAPDCSPQNTKKGTQNPRKLQDNKDFVRPKKSAVNTVAGCKDGSGKLSITSPFTSSWTSKTEHKFTTKQDCTTLELQAAPNDGQRLTMKQNCYTAWLQIARDDDWKVAEMPDCSTPRLQTAGNNDQRQTMKPDCSSHRLQKDDQRLTMKADHSSPRLQKDDQRLTMKADHSSPRLQKDDQRLTMKTNHSSSRLQKDDQRLTMKPDCSTPRLQKHDQRLSMKPDCFSPRLQKDDQSLTMKPDCSTPRLQKDDQRLSMKPDCFSPKLQKDDQRLTMKPDCSYRRLQKDYQRLTMKPDSSTPQLQKDDQRLTMKLDCSTSWPQKDDQRLTMKPDCSTTWLQKDDQRLTIKPDCSTPRPQKDDQRLTMKSDCFSPRLQKDDQRLTMKPDCSTPRLQKDDQRLTMKPDCSTPWLQKDDNRLTMKLDCSTSWPQKDDQKLIMKPDCSTPWLQKDDQRLTIKPVCSTPRPQKDDHRLTMKSDCFSPRLQKDDQKLTMKPDCSTPRLQKDDQRLTMKPDCSTPWLQKDDQRLTMKPNCSTPPLQKDDQRLTMQPDCSAPQLQKDDQRLTMKPDCSTPQLQKDDQKLTMKPDCSTPRLQKDDQRLTMKPDCSTPWLQKDDQRLTMKSDCFSPRLQKDDQRLTMKLDCSTSWLQKDDQRLTMKPNCSIPRLQKDDQRLTMQSDCSAPQLQKDDQRLTMKPHCSTPQLQKDDQRLTMKPDCSTPRLQKDVQRLTMKPDSSTPRLQKDDNRLTMKPDCSTFWPQKDDQRLTMKPDCSTPRLRKDDQRLTRKLDCSTPRLQKDDQRLTKKSDCSTPRLQAGNQRLNMKPNCCKFKTHDKKIANIPLVFCSKIPRLKTSLWKSDFSPSLFQAGRNGVSMASHKTGEDDVVGDNCKFQTDYKKIVNSPSVLCSNIPKLKTPLQKSVKCVNSQPNVKRSQMTKNIISSLHSSTRCINTSKIPRIVRTQYVTLSQIYLSVMEHQELEIKTSQDTYDSRLRTSSYLRASSDNPTSFNKSFFSRCKEDSHIASRNNLTNVQNSKVDDSESTDVILKRPDLTGKIKIPLKFSEVPSSRQDNPQKMLNLTSQIDPEIGVNTLMMCKEMYRGAADPSTRKVLDLKRWYCISRPQYTTSSGISSIVSCWNFLFSAIGHGSVRPIAQETALKLLGFVSPFDNINFEPIADNITLLRWFNLLNVHFGVTGQCYFMYKPVGQNQTTGITDEKALDMLKQGLKDERTAFIYHCFNHYFCPIGYEDTLQCCVDVYKGKVGEDADTYVLIGDTSRDFHSLHCVSWKQICRDLNCGSPDYLDIRQIWKGVMHKAENTSIDDENCHCILAFRKCAENVQESLISDFSSCSISSSFLSSSHPDHLPDSSESLQALKLSLKVGTSKIIQKDPDNTKIKDDSYKQDVNTYYNPDLNYQACSQNLSDTKYHFTPCTLSPLTEKAELKITSDSQEYQRQNICLSEKYDQSLEKQEKFDYFLNAKDGGTGT